MALYDRLANRRSRTLILVHALFQVQKLSLIINKQLDNLDCDWPGE
jgi:hypothetical protein